MVSTLNNLTKMARLSVVSDLIQIYNTSVLAVQPQKLIKEFVKYNPNNEELNINGNKFDLINKKVFVVGAGKAVQHMAKEIHDILERKIKKGIISIPEGSLAENIKCSKFKFCEGAKNNLPDSNAMEAANEIKNLAVSLTSNDVLLVLISGGGSALLPLPKEPISLKEKTDLVKRLANSGADITELNTVRKKISNIKGGKLAIYARPALTISLILSDIVGDPLDLIASGPTIENKDDAEKAAKVVKKYLEDNEVSDSVKQVLSEKNINVIFPSDQTFNYVLGSNKLSLSTAENESKNLNYLPVVLSNTVTGNVKDLAKEYVKLAKAYCDYLEKNDIEKLKSQLEALKIPGIQTDNLNLEDVNVGNKPICLILGGEPTVEVKGKGLGGRNQQLALEFSVAIDKVKNDFKNVDVYFLSAGTDGIDGPTDAAGAVGYLDLITDCINDKIDVQKYLEDNDSYNFFKTFKDGQFHIIKGHTNTNVMDVHLLIISRLGTRNKL